MGNHSEEKDSLKIWMVSDRSLPTTTHTRLTIFEPFFYVTVWKRSKDALQTPTSLKTVGWQMFFFVAQILLFPAKQNKETKKNHNSYVPIITNYSYIKKKMQACLNCQHLSTVDHSSSQLQSLDNLCSIMSITHRDLTCSIHQHQPAPPCLTSPPSLCCASNFHVASHLVLLQQQTQTDTHTKKANVRFAMTAIERVIFNWMRVFFFSRSGSAQKETLKKINYIFRFKLENIQISKHHQGCDLSSKQGEAQCAVSCGWATHLRAFCGLFRRRLQDVGVADAKRGRVRLPPLDSL